MAARTVERRNAIAAVDQAWRSSHVEALVASAYLFLYIFGINQAFATNASTTRDESCFEKDRRCPALRPRAAKKRRQKMLSHRARLRQTARLTLETSAGRPIDQATRNWR